MKVLYLSNVHFSDLDFSLMPELMRQYDTYYIMEVHSKGLRSCAVDFKSAYPHSGLYPACVYPEMEKFGKLFDLSRMYVLNMVIGNKLSRLFATIKREWQLFRFVKKNRIDVIHITYVPDVARFWIYWFKNKLIISRHDPIFHSDTVLSNNLKKRISKAYEKCNRFLLYNKSQRDEFIRQNHLENKRVFVSRFGVYSYLNIYKDLIKADNTGNYILFFGRISRYKGLEYLFEAMKLVHEKMPDLRLIVAGAGKYHFDITEYSKLPYIQIENRFIDDLELSQLISNSLFVVCPYTDATQSGVLMTNYAWNKSAIVTNVGGLPEMVGFGKYGVIVPPKDTAYLAESIISLAQDSARRQVLEQNIKDEYSTGSHSWSQIIKEYEEFYK